MTTRKLTLTVLALLATLTTGYLALTPAALAARGHVFEKSFGREGSGNGELKEPEDIAVDEANGDVYVADKGNNRIEWFSATGTYEGQFNGQEIDGVPAGAGKEAPAKLSEPQSIAVDNSCQEHKPKPLTGTACEEFDPSDGDVYVAVEHEYLKGVVDKFTAAGEYVGQVAVGGASVGGGKFGRLSSVAVDANGILWAVVEITLVSVYYHYIGVVAFPQAKHNEFTEIESRELHETQASSPTLGFAVDSQDDFYISLASPGLGSTLFEFNPGGQHVGPQEIPVGEDYELSTGVATERVSNDVYADYARSIVRYSAEGKALETLAVPGEHGSGVAVSAASEDVYVADSGGGVVDLYVPKEPSEPEVASESLSDITAESASFGAGINPNGAATEYRFEYGRCASAGACASAPYEASVPVPDGFVGADFELHTVGPLRVLGLRPGSVYHMRVVAHNVIGGVVRTVDGEAKVFTMQVAGGEFGLPDGREWEMVSPPDKQGALIAPLGGFGFEQAADGGDAFTFVAGSPSEREASGTASDQVQVFATRGAGGWTSRVIAAPHQQATGASINYFEYEFFSADLSLGVVQPFGQLAPCRSAEGAALPCLSEAASEQTAFLRSDFVAGGGNEICTNGCYRPLVTGCPSSGACAPAVREAADVPPGVTFGQGRYEAGKPCSARSLLCGPEFVGASADGTHVALWSNVSLTPVAGSAPAGGLYEWNAGAPAGKQLVLASVLPGTAGPAGSAQLGSDTGFGSRAAGAVSDDGSRVVWSTKNGMLYLRDVALEKTVELDAGEAGCGSCASGGGEFQFQSADGSRVLFTDWRRLTRDAGAEQLKPDLYECEVVVSEGSPACVLRDLTPVESGEVASVQGGIVGASEDGAWVYFVADGVQEGASNPHAVRGTCIQGFTGDHQNASTPGSSCNLYVRHGGVTRLVAVLASEDYPDWRFGLGGGEDHLSRVAPDGEWAAFMSRRSLTGYDNRDALSGRSDEEVYLYHAGAGTLVCASCNPTGGRPRGAEYVTIKQGLVGSSESWDNSSWIAASVPEWTPYGTAAALYQSRYLSDSGRLFFNSLDPLVSQDVNGTEDVYEYEPDGVGSCGAGSDSGSVVFKPARAFAAGGLEGEEAAGCVGLISSGTSAEESAFMDASETGGDVFFLTSASLVSQDVDTLLDVYDAHECTGVSPCSAGAPVAPPACATEASCRPAPSPQPAVFGAPASATFTGQGNAVASSSSPVAVVGSRAVSRAQRLARALRACRAKKRRARRAGCEAVARGRYGARRSGVSGKRGR